MSPFCGITFPLLFPTYSPHVKILLIIPMFLPFPPHCILVSPPHLSLLDRRTSSVTEDVAAVFIDPSEGGRVHQLQQRTIQPHPVAIFLTWRETLSSFLLQDTYASLPSLLALP